ncbi:hypothetical protein jhhlp_008596 [Lomentospora prolificans]|uniref:Amino acid permease/ SLC12A domain-containing protein n=1 Tax=Lomentospora prolificans TaxID=41688 RepID=A0A2N3MYI8_9PEZI|nr:hypothetical protein jhhlp_008596 [Lomentospora prolificans]
MAGSRGQEHARKAGKLGVLSGVYIPVCLSILSILMFLRFGLILGQIGLLGILGLLVTAYIVDFITTLSLSAIASNGEVKGGGAYYLISRSLGPEFGGSIGLLFYLSQVLNTALNVVGLIDCIRLNIGPAFPQGYWQGYALQTFALLACTSLCMAGSAIFAKASNALLIILSVAILTIPVSALVKRPFHDEDLGIEFTGISLHTLRDNLLPHSEEASFKGLTTFRDLFGILFPATSGIFAGASMSGDLRNPSKAIPRGTLWAMLTTFVAYLIVIISMAASTTHDSFLRNANVIPETNISPILIFAGECAVTVFSALMGVIGSAKLLQALTRDKLLPGLAPFARGTRNGDEPVFAMLLTYAIAQFALLADLNQIATFISMGYQMTFFVMNLACFLLKVGSAPNFRPGFKFFSWQAALAGSFMSASAMFFTDETYAAASVCLVIFLFSLIHYLSPPKRWGDVSQNLIYHQVRKYLLRLKPEHIKFWRPQIILLVNNPRHQTRLIQLCNSMKKGALYILGHVIVTDDFNTGVHEAKLQQHAWANFISEIPRLKAFVQLTMSPSITWGIRNLILSAGLGGMRPNIAVLGFYNMDELRRTRPLAPIPSAPTSPTSKAKRPAAKAANRRRGDTAARLLEGFLPTDVIRTEEMMSAMDYMTILEDLTLRYKLNVAVGKGCEQLEMPRQDGSNSKKYIDLWPIQMSAEILSDGKSILTTNFDTYTLILQLGYILNSVPAWRKAYKLRVLVFVEYESEVGEEIMRVRTLLDKLRIEAVTCVFCLASGDLRTYEAIINGRCEDDDLSDVVNTTLEGEDWWEDLKQLRGLQRPVSPSQEMGSLASILDAPTVLPVAHSPQYEAINLAKRHASVADLRDLQSKPSVSRLARLGVNVGIHTHRLGDDAFDDQIDQLDRLDSDGENSDADSKGGISDSDLETRAHSPASDGGVEGAEPSTRPLLGSVLRRRSFGDALRDHGSSKRNYEPHGRRRRKPPRVNSGHTPSYGSISLPGRPEKYLSPSNNKVTQPQLRGRQEDQRQNLPSFASQTLNLNHDEHDAPVLQGFAETADEKADPPLPSPPRLYSPIRQPRLPRVASDQNSTLMRGLDGDTLADRRSQGGESTPSVMARPGLSRQSSAMRFTSKPLPETKTDVEGHSGPTIMFAGPAQPPVTSLAERPPLSRQSSTGRFPGRSTLDSKLHDGTESSRVSFSEPLYHHRRGTARSEPNLDQRINIPELLNSTRVEPPKSVRDDSSTYSTQSLALSFNDLPSRAQHLILNELIRKSSADTAIIFTTLPIPSDGTCLDEGATLRYLSDVEVLCNGLPPVLLILSNSMTVTVGL